MSGETPTYGPEDVARRLDRTLPGWRYERGWIRRRLEGEGWPAAMLPAAAVAYLAEAAYHHPDLVLTARGGSVKLRHHFAAGITDLDFELAEEIEACLRWPAEAEATPPGGPAGPPREGDGPGEGPD